MADSGSEDEQSPQITITLKSTTENHPISLADNSTIGKVIFCKLILEVICIVIHFIG